MKAAEQSQIMYNEFLLDLRTRYSPDKIFDGKFGAMMDVSLVNSVGLESEFSNSSSTHSNNFQPL